MFVLDTNTVIHFFKRKGRVAERLLATPAAEIALPAVVVFELEKGVRRSIQHRQRIERLEQFLAAVRILPFGHATAVAAAEIAAGLESGGAMIGPLDTLIAATAIEHDAVLVTHNTAEFSRVPGLRLADWFL